MCDFINDIKENYLKMERELVTQLNYDVTNHQLTAGTYREEIWADFFRKIVPRKFNIARSVFIIDSKENISNEVDIAIYDEQYTPYIFNYGLIKFIPIEAVAAVVQCKSRSLDKDDLLNWTNSIKNLQTSNDSIVRLATYIHIGKESICDAIQTATKPIKILCHIPTDETCNDDTNGREYFDIVIEAYQNSKSSKEQTQNNTEYNVSKLFCIIKIFYYFIQILHSKILFQIFQFLFQFLFLFKYSKFIFIFIQFLNSFFYIVKNCLSCNSTLFCNF